MEFTCVCVSVRGMCLLCEVFLFYARAVFIYMIIFIDYMYNAQIEI